MIEVNCFRNETIHTCLGLVTGHSQCTATMQVGVDWRTCLHSR